MSILDSTLRCSLLLFCYSHKPTGIDFIILSNESKQIHVYNNEIHVYNNEIHVYNNEMHSCYNFLCEQLEKKKGAHKITKSHKDQLKHWF